VQLEVIVVVGEGGVLRYGVGRVVQPETFPAATLTVNVTGSFAIGLLATLLFERSAIPADLRTALLVGMLGSYTTFSTFSFETLELMNDGRWSYAALNVAASVAGALAAVWAGQALARQ
jgi:CrcB protein